MKFINKKLDEWILIFGFSVILTLVFAQVLFRYIIHIPIIGLFDELARFLFIWIAWLAVSYSIRTDSHIRIEMFTDIFFKNKKYVVKYIENILFIGFAVFLV